MNEIFFGSYIHKKGDMGMVWGELKAIYGGMRVWSVKPKRRNNGLTGCEDKYGGYREQNL